MIVHIRWFCRRDMPEVLDIENESFEFPWSEEDLIRRLRQCDVTCMVAEHNEQVVGFMVYELHRTRLHLLNFAVAQNLRRQGIGRQMIEKLQSNLSPHRRTRMLFNIRETNMGGQWFLKATEWKAVLVLRNYYDYEKYGRTDEDAYLMEYHPVLVERDVATLEPLEANGC